jgi:polysaccharide biosynthesis protein PslG
MGNGGGRRVRSMPALVGAVTTALLVLPGPAAAAATPAHRVPDLFFGLHDPDATSWPGIDVGSLRLWDSGTTWRDLERAPGRFDFRHLDRVVRTARQHRARVLLVLGQTPTFHVAVGASPARAIEYNGPGSTRTPDLPAWRRYVRTVADRYAGRIGALQVWNEANIPGFWSGRATDLAALTDLARSEVDRANRRHRTAMKLVSPGFVARTNTLVMDQFWAARRGGHSMNDLVDAAAVSLYPPVDGGPEQALGLLRYVRRAILRPRGVTRPVWDTEINYGLSVGGAGGAPPFLDRQRQAAFVMRTLLLQAAAGVDRVYWYAWDLTGTVSVVTNRGEQVTAAGRAFAKTRRWLGGGVLSGCHRSPDGRLRGTWECRVALPHAVRHIFWNPHRVVRVLAPGATTWTRTLDGHRSRAVAGQPLEVDDRPILVRSRR